MNNDEAVKQPRLLNWITVINEDRPQFSVDSSSCELLKMQPNMHHCYPEINKTRKLITDEKLRGKEVVLPIKCK